MTASTTPVPNVHRGHDRVRRAGHHLVLALNRRTTYHPACAAHLEEVAMIPTRVATV
ncbi:hypothetical protein [Streptomyces sp. NBC_01431]|uniref:hypothetical protein n=1 Tax=Streptomyces sp. NBC_01431 TaxID=2903863 RepID=UPI002E36B4A0|nr:hypothetical protein [Streptomyces sp. NBC_01431]